MEIRQAMAALAWRTRSAGLVFVAVLLVFGSLADPAAAQDRSAARAAFNAVTADRWDEAYSYARASGDPLATKLVFYYDAIRSDSLQTFEAVSAFMAANPEWPQQKKLQARAELAMTADMPPSQVIAWFASRQPITGNGGLRLAQALRRSGDTTRAATVMREAWRTGDFGASTEKEVLDEFANVLTADDHVRRLDRLLWDGESAQVERMRARVGPGWSALADARTRLRNDSAGAEAALNRVPANLQNDPGLIYERVRWRRKKERDGEARALLAGSPDAGPPDRWWTERSVLARRALNEGLASEAYRTASGHRMTAGSEFAEAEFLAGWIALRFLNDPGRARGHFLRLYDSVEFPISRARGAYWLGRADQAGGDKASATTWFRTAAAHPTTFYGQLAGLSVDPGWRPALQPVAAASAAETAAFEAHELTRAVRLLSAVDQEQRLNPILLHLAGLRPSPGWKTLTGKLAVSLGHRHLGVFVAKEAYKSGDILIDLSYPQLAPPPPAGGGRLEPAFALAVIRQESAFQTDAVSAAGARGLMQLMPATAKTVAGQSGLPHHPERLTSDPDFNMALGQRYLADVLDQFSGSKVLALCAYNAGPGRASRWRESNGDPHASVERAVDWIEMIPFTETRNYVQRVLENLQVYRARQAGAGANRTLHDDLLRRS